MITRSQELMKGLLMNCGLSNEEASIETLFLETHENNLKMLDWLESRNFQATKDEISSQVGQIIKESLGRV